MNIKRIKAVIAASLCVFMLAGCAGAGTSSGASQNTESTSDTAVSTTESTTDATEATKESKPQEEEIILTDKIIALTFDDGPNTTTTVQVLDLLQKYDITASFFLIGNNINGESAEVVKRAYDIGCEIHNHSQSHPDMTKLTADRIKEEFEFTDSKVFEITGEHTKFFRPPYIAVNDLMLETLDVPFIAGIGANDWDDNISAEKRARAILRKAKDGDVILLHDAAGNDKTVEALDTIIPELKAQGYTFVTMTQLFKYRNVEISAEDTKIYTNVLQEYQYG